MAWVRQNGESSLINSVISNPDPELSTLFAVSGGVQHANGGPLKASDYQDCDHV